MAGPKILIPYNFTKHDEKCVDFAIQRYGPRENAQITLFHAYIPVPKIEVSDKTVMGRIAGNLTYLQQKITEYSEEIARAAARFTAAGFSHDQIHTIFKPQEKEAASEIVEAAREGEFDTILLNRRPAAISKFFTPSVSKKVSLALKDLEIIMVS
ncbi:MAG: universal stress protein [Desulfobacterales bacterium]